MLKSCVIQENIDVRFLIISIILLLRCSAFFPSVCLFRIRCQPKQMASIVDDGGVCWCCVWWWVPPKAYDAIRCASNAKSVVFQLSYIAIITSKVIKKFIITELRMIFVVPHILFPMKEKIGKANKNKVLSPNHGSTKTDQNVRWKKKWLTATKKKCVRSKKQWNDDTIEEARCGSLNLILTSLCSSWPYYYFSLLHLGTNQNRWKKERNY